MLTLVSGGTALPLSAVEMADHLRTVDPVEYPYLTSLIRAAVTLAEVRCKRTLVASTWRLTLDDFPCDIIEIVNPPLVSVSSIIYTATDGTSTTWSSSEYTVDTYSEPGRIYPAYGYVWPSARNQPNAVTVTYTAGHACPFTAATSNTITVSGRTYTNGDRVRVWNAGGTLPGGLSSDTDYYVISVSGSTLSLSATSGGAAVDITSTGDGTHFIGEIPANIRHALKLIAAHWYENREPVLVGTISSNLPMAADHLLSFENWGSLV